MPRGVGLNKEKITLYAAEVVDREGMHALTLKKVAQHFQVRTPSLYKHIKGLDELKGAVAAYGMELLEERLAKAMTKHDGIEAIRELMHAYVSFAREHGGLYETIQWMNVADGEAAESLFSEVVKLMYDTSASIGVDEAEASHITRVARSLAHGLACINAHGGFFYPASIEETADYAIDTFILGLKAKWSSSEGGIRKDAIATALEGKPTRHRPNGEKRGTTI